MFELFYRRAPFQEGLVEDGSLPHVRERCQGELARLEDYYHNRNSKVNNSNMLARLILTGCPSYDLDLIEFINIVDATAKYSARTFDITTTGNVGKIHNGVTFGLGSNELFITQDNGIDPFSMESNWKNVKAIRTLYHNMDVIDYLRPDPDYDFYVPYIFIYGIDLKILFLQYRYWVLERLKNESSTDPAVFVYQYVFTAMIGDIMDISLYNRFMSFMRDETPSDSYTRRHPIALLDYSSKIDNILMKHVGIVKQGDIEFITFMKRIPSLYADNAYTLFFNTNLVNVSAQSRWVNILATIFIIRDILTNADEKTLRRNKSDLHALKRSLRLYKRGNELERPMDDYLQLEFATAMLSITNLIGG